MLLYCSKCVFYLGTVYLNTPWGSEWFHPRGHKYILNYKGNSSNDLLNHFDKFVLTFYLLEIDVSVVFLTRYITKLLIGSTCDVCNKNIFRGKYCKYCK